MDSEPISIALMIEFAAKAGVVLSIAQAYEAFLGKPISTMHKSVYELCKVGISHLDEYAFQEAIFVQFQTELAAVDQIKWALKNLEGQRCVASSSSLERVNVNLH